MTDDAQPNAIEVEQLVVERGGQRVLPGVDLRVPSGTVTGLLGPSGCGKSTLMRSIVGVQRIASGDVRVLGSTAGSSTVRRRVGYVTQESSVYDDLSVRENLDFFARVLDASADRTVEVLEQVDLARYGARLVGTLSGGQRSRASLAVALLGAPELLVLDEPTVGLDPVLREQLWALFRELADGGTTVLVSSHVMEEAARCDRLLLMYDGRIVADDTPDGIRARGGSHDLDACFLQLVREQRGASR
jgi:ABC-2 type transport system ATP-binding protein